MDTDVYPEWGDGKNRAARQSNKNPASGGKSWRPDHPAADLCAHQDQGRNAQRSSM
jgi:hypothetical protein